MRSQDRLELREVGHRLIVQGSQMGCWTLPTCERARGGYAHEAMRDTTFGLRFLRGGDGGREPSLAL